MILLTGCAGFIGFHTSLKLLEAGYNLLAIDNLNDYYDLKLKKDRLAKLKQFKSFSFYHKDLTDQSFVDYLLKTYQNDITHIIHLAAQAGVRYSLKNPQSYILNNILAHTNLLESAQRHLTHKFEHFIYASSSSVYSGNSKIPFAIDDPLEVPKSVYAASKINCEILAKTYHYLYKLPLTGLRFFTVYGPYGRPDMTPILFSKAIKEKKPITLYEAGKLKRDFTYIDDITSGILSLIQYGFNPHFPLYNLGNNSPVEMRYFVQLLEKNLSQKAIIKNVKTPPTEPFETYADISLSKKNFGFNPQTSIEDGLHQFCDWFKDYYHL